MEPERKDLDASRMRKSSSRESFCCCYNAAVFREQVIIGIISVLSVNGLAQETKPAQQKPEVKVHMLNVCSPSAEEQQEIVAALAHVPKKPAFSEDLEVDRGRSVLDQSANPLSAVNPAAASPAEKTIADFVRVRRDITGSGTYSTVQYSFSRDSQQMVETLVLRVRDPKDLLQLSIEDSASSVTTAAAMLASATPPSRIKLERFGNSSVVLARCSGTADSPPADQSAYEPLFASAASVMASYRTLLGAATLVPEELSRIRRFGASAKTVSPTKQGSGKHP
jgi:hypothetical protein